MSETGKIGWLNDGSGWNEEEVLLATKGNESGQILSKTVMVYWIDKKNMQKEPIGILTERRKSERDDNNVIGMLRLARKEFAKKEEDSQSILISDYI